MLFSVVIPAHNEEDYIGYCINSIYAARKYAKIPENQVQIIVVCNRCTDNTAALAQKMGAEVCINDDKCIAAVRNAGAKLAKGKILVTIDADSTMTKTSLIEIYRMLRSKKYIGGGTISTFDRWSLGIAASAAYVAINAAPYMIEQKAPLMCGMFWCLKRHFDEIGGFDETLVSLEDMDFAVRLKKLGEKLGRKYGVLKKSRIITSSRKFDEFGDWYLIKNRDLTKAIFTGKDREAADKFYYDLRDKK